MRHPAPQCIKTLLAILFLFTSVYTSNAQVQDSIAEALKSQIETETSDSLRIPLQIKLARQLALFDVDSAKAVLFTIKNTLESKNDTSFYYKKQKGDMLESLADCFSIQEDLPEALAYQQEAIDIRISINDSIGLGGSYESRARLYAQKNDLDKAKTFYKKALNIQKKYSSPEEIAATFLAMGVLYSKNKERDSAVYFYEQARKVDTSLTTKVTVDTNLATMFLIDGDYENASVKFRESIGTLKELNNYMGLTTIYLNLAVAQAQLKSYDTSLQAIDSALIYSKKLGSKEMLMKQYYTRRNINSRKGDYKAAYEDAKLYKIYSDSINDVEEVKRFTELELTYKFDKEKELAAIQLAAETARKKLYFLLLLVLLCAGIILVYFIRKSNKQKLALAAKEVALVENEIALKEVEQLNTELALANRESELKKVVVETAITEEVLNKALSDMEEIFSYDNKEDMAKALRSVSATLLSEKASQKDTVSLQQVLDAIDIDFKVKLDRHFLELKTREKELLCLIKAGLTTSEMGKYLNASVSSVKSLRYRIRKKLHLDSDIDMIAYIQNQE